MKKRNKRIQPKHYGLFHGSLRIAVEDVTGRHKKDCVGCADLPEGRRLKVTFGGGRSSTAEIFCDACGTSWLEDHSVELDRAIQRLNGVKICVRQRECDGD